MNIHKIEKGTIAILGYFDGTAISFGFSKKGYETFASTIKKGGRQQLESLLPEFGTKEGVAEALYQQMVEMHNKILAIASFVDDEVLKRAWGADWEFEKVVWMINISTLLHLKRIKNDEMYGWMLMDHNSTVAMKDTGAEIAVMGKDAEKLLKKGRALVATYKK